VAFRFLSCLKTKIPAFLHLFVFDRGGRALYAPLVLMQWVLMTCVLAGAYASAPALEGEPPRGGGHDVELDAHASWRASLPLLGYSNPLRKQLEANLQRWENEGEARAFLLPPIEDMSTFDLAYVQGRYDIPLEMHPLVSHYVQFFQGAGRKWFVRWLGRSTRYVPIMRPILEKARLPRDTVYLAMIESGFSPYAYSWAHASGPWQFIPSTGAHYGLRQDFWVDERRDPIKSTEAAARYLTDLYRKKGDWFLAWASYNAGETRVRRVMARHQSTDFWELAQASNLAKETKHYVPKLIAAALMAKHPEAFGFSREEISYQPPFEFDEVLLDATTDLSLVAKLIDCPLELLQGFNPELLHGYTPPASPSQPYVLRLPRGFKAAFEGAYALLSAQEKSGARPYLIRQGDTLRKIAANAKLPPLALAEFNQLHPNAPLRAGQNLLLPNADLFDSLRPQASQSARRGKRPVVYRVRPGDSLWSISRKFDVELKSLQSWNRSLLGKHKTLQPGMQLNIRP